MTSCSFRPLFISLIECVCTQQHTPPSHTHTRLIDAVRFAHSTLQITPHAASCPHQSTLSPARQPSRGYHIIIENSGGTPQQINRNAERQHTVQCAGSIKSSTHKGIFQRLYSTAAATATSPPPDYKSRMPATQKVISRSILRHHHHNYRYI